jgi:hypothetical protein
MELRRRGFNSDAINFLPVATESENVASELQPEQGGINYRQQAAIGIPFGFILMLFGHVLRGSEIEDSIFVASLLTVGGIVLFLWGCVGYSMGKGYSKWLGTLGVLGCIGVVILALLPDRRKEYDDHTS